MGLEGGEDVVLAMMQGLLGVVKETRLTKRDLHVY